MSDERVIKPKITWSKERVFESDFGDEHQEYAVRKARMIEECRVFMSSVLNLQMQCPFLHELLFYP